MRTFKKLNGLPDIEPFKNHVLPKGCWIFRTRIFVVKLRRKGRDSATNCSTWNNWELPAHIHQKNANVRRGNSANP